MRGKSLLLWNTHLVKGLVTESAGLATQPRTIPWISAVSRGFGAHTLHCVCPAGLSQAGRAETYPEGLGKLAGKAGRESWQAVGLLLGQKNILLLAHRAPATGSTQFLPLNNVMMVAFCLRWQGKDFKSSQKTAPKPSVAFRKGHFITFHTNCSVHM